MREMARCEVDGLPTPTVPQEVLNRIGVTSQSVAIAWIRRNSVYGNIKQRLESLTQGGPAN